MKYLALDIGNVLVTVHFERFLDLLSRTANISMEDAKHFLKKIQKIHDLGLTDIKQELENSFNIKSPGLINDLKKEWARCGLADEYVINRILKWNNEIGLKIALLSNIGIEHAEIMPKLLKHDDFYNKTITHFSCEVGARKPSMIYYQSFLRQFPEFYGCVYVDDLHENLEASKKFGFKTFHFTLEDGANVYDNLDKLEKFLKE